jgi:hypothetical protein
MLVISGLTCCAANQSRLERRRRRGTGYDISGFSRHIAPAAGAAAAEAGAEIIRSAITALQ